jgi:signal peptidase I
MNKAVKSTISWIIYLAVLAGLVWGTPKALTYFLHTSYPMASITSGSMWPVLKQGDMVFIEGIKSKGEIKIGDIVVYNNPSLSSGQVQFTIHRVVKMNQDTVVTKGDANDVEDSPVSYEEIIGKAVYWRGSPLRIPLLGNISIMLNGAKT